MVEAIVHSIAALNAISFFLLLYLGIMLIGKTSSRHRKVGIGILFFSMNFLGNVFFIYLSVISEILRAIPILFAALGVIIIAVELL